MKILAIETAGEVCSCALLIDADLRTREMHAPRRHNELVLPMVRDLLAEAGIVLGGLDAIAFGAGPGAFTGVRIAASVAQGLGAGAQLGLAPISSLAATAHQAWQQRRWRSILVAFDARMNEVYWGGYRFDEAEILPALPIAECVTAPTAAPIPDSGQWLGVGSGWGAYPELLRSRAGDRLAGVMAELQPLAGNVALLAVAAVHDAALMPAEQARPNYLRNRVVQGR